MTPRLDGTLVRVSLVFPYHPDCRFDLGDFCHHYVPELRHRLGTACLGVAVETGLAGEEEDWATALLEPELFVTVAHLYFADTQDLYQALAPDDTTLLAQRPLCTDVWPIVHIGQGEFNDEFGFT